MNTRSLPGKLHDTSRSTRHRLHPVVRPARARWIGAIRTVLDYLDTHPTGCEIAARRILRESRG